MLAPVSHSLQAPTAPCCVHRHFDIGNSTANLDLDPGVARVAPGNRQPRYRQPMQRKEYARLCTDLDVAMSAAFVDRAAADVSRKDPKIQYQGLESWRELLAMTLC
jgi:hypothetical protein